MSSILIRQAEAERDAALEKLAALSCVDSGVGEGRARMPERRRLMKDKTKTARCWFVGKKESDGWDVPFKDHLCEAAEKYARDSPDMGRTLRVRHDGRVHEFEITYKIEVLEVRHTERE
jgi:hypothetical protein